jgi:signal transduction histidine kinase
VALGLAAGVLSVFGAERWAWPWLLVATAIVVARAWWRTMPSLLLILVPAGLVLVTEATGTSQAGWFIVCVALVLAGAGPKSAVTWAAAGAVLLMPVGLWVARVDDYIDHGFVPWTWTMGLLLSAAFGVVLGRQRELIAQLEAQQAQLAEAAAADERRRIAHELHDVVGHSFSVVLLHLAGARRLLDSDPERARRALADAEDVGRRSMEDLRSALVLLRSPDDTAEPAHGIDELPQLAQQYRSAGLDVTYTAHGDPNTVDPAGGVVLYGVAREALTNAAKHGVSGSVVVDLDATHEPVLTVRNPVPWSVHVPAIDGRGRTQGVAGMRARVEALGGRLDVVADSGVWQVRAELPVRVAADRA